MSNKVPENILRLKGTYRRDRHGGVKVKRQSPPSPNQLYCPKWLNEHQRAAFNELKQACRAADIALLRSDLPLLGQVSVLYAELMTAPDSFSSSKHAQLRLLFRCLGLADSEPGED